MTQNQPPSADHARHDRLVVVRYLDLDDDLLAGEVTEARALLANCSQCAALATELQLITDATNRMALPARSRDFRLTPQQAASLRPTGLRTLLENAGKAFRFEFLRPLAGAAVAIGLLLVVVGSLPLSNAAHTADLAVGGAASQRAAAADAATLAPMAPGSTGSFSNFDAQPTAEAANLTPVPQVALESGAPMSAPTGKNGATTAAPAAVTNAPTAVTAPPPAPFASDSAAVSSPATGTTTAVVPQGTPVAYQPPTAGNSGAALAGGSDRDTGPISPLLILGGLLAGVGLLVLLLTFVARRIGRSAS